MAATPEQPGTTQQRVSPRLLGIHREENIKQGKELTAPCGPGPVS